MSSLSATRSVAPSQEIAPPAFVPARTLYAVTIFLSAFLLFQVQLIIGKYILPWFGGSASVWNTCLLFFQVLLLAGYGYAHLLSTRLPVRWQFRLHLILLLVSFAVLAVVAYGRPSPITPGAVWRPVPGRSPVWQVVRVLLASVGF